ncbi:hypothetical protein Phum_PHUM626240 [Pediculus humanus corporis]|uniref:Uncharacterized protein n=1 Tax=Pediculus humanus subsp. corporis TaxID=121224 RepID=E0VND9_PEDHC|nr:uncharacterized protein Phum_PHUM626240 [Pediculus humanus corporis]EEB14895.1 hypothetical protein Phum_PHUM626240 [Pediculus humanus corporis]
MASKAVNEYFGSSRPSKIPVLAEGLPLDGEEYNTPSEDSGVCLGDGRTNERANWIAATSPSIYRKQTSDLALSNGENTNLIVRLVPIDNGHNLSCNSLLKSSVALTIFLDVKNAAAVLLSSLF